MSPADHLTTETLDERITLVTMNRPERLNALSQGLVADLHRVFDEIARDRSCRAVVLTGAGRGFCAGADMGGLQQIGDEAGDGGAKPAAEAPARVEASDTEDLEALYPGRFGYLYRCPRHLQLRTPATYLQNPEANPGRGITATAGKNKTPADGDLYVDQRRLCVYRDGSFCQTEGRTRCRTTKRPAISKFSGIFNACKL